MIKTFNITKKLHIRLIARNFKSSFTFISVYFNRFIDYKFVFQFLNIELMFQYENTKQREALEKLHETMSSMEEYEKI